MSELIACMAVIIALLGLFRIKAESGHTKGMLLGAQMTLLIVQITLLVFILTERA